MDFAVTTQPTAEPLLLDDVKNYLRTIVGDDSEDAAILIPMITAAREFCENATGRALAVCTVTAYPRNFEPAYLPRLPIVSLESASYKDKDGVEHVLEDGECVISNDKVYFPNVNATSLYGINPIQVSYTAGYSEGTLPPALRQAMLMLIAHWYNNREAVQIGSRINEVSADHAFENLIKHYRVWWF
jgi:uncharacterized phiE125 gp8 family phage protein